MSLEEEFTEALRQINERARLEEDEGSRRFARDLTIDGGLTTARKLLQPSKPQEGFMALMAKGRPDLTLEAVVLEPRFQPLFDEDLLAEARRRLGWEDEPSIRDVTGKIEELSQGRPIGGLQPLRKKLKNLKRLPAQTIFHDDTIHDRYAFHYGGRSELQFNIGIIELETGGPNFLRDGVAISLQRSQSFHDIDEQMLNRIDRFNEYLETYPDDFADLVMYHNPHLDTGEWSGLHEVRPIPGEIVRFGTFIFLGRVQPCNAISVGQIVDDFDRLLPLYEFVEGTQDFPTIPVQTQRPPGLTKKPAHTTMTVAAQKLDRDQRHNVVQYALGRALQEQYGNCVWDEYATGNGTKVDLFLENEGRRAIYEIKTGSSARRCIRDAIGQLLEYAYWPGALPADELVIVGEARYDSKAKEYLETLRREFSLPLSYRRFDVKRRVFA